MPVTVKAEHAGGGPYYFAWVDPEETEFGDEHIRYDEYILTFSLPQSEGDFATLSVEIPNPGKGLFAPGRKIWAWLAWNGGGTDSDIDSDTVGVMPLFFGRVVGLPTDLLKETITVQFTARPLDYADQKIALADELRQLPEYDPVFVDEAHRDDPDTVLEGYSAIWHSDRVSHEVTVSDFLVGEDGVIEFDGIDAFYEGVEVTLESFPQSSIDLDATVTWQQQATGTIDFGARNFESFTGNTLAQGWPEAGTDLQSGWSVYASSAVAPGADRPMINYNFSWQNQAKKHRNGDTMSITESFSAPLGYGPEDGITLSDDRSFTIGDPHTGTPASSGRSRSAVVINSVGGARTTLVLKYDSDRKREEHLKFTLVSDLQPIIFSPPDDPAGSDDPVEISGADVGIAIDDTIPIGDLARGSYFETDRGLRSVENLILRARAKLILAARVGRVSWQCQFADAVELSCRKNALLRDPRVSGGEALGKIVNYELNGNGDSGEFIGKVTIACAVGTGAAVTETAGAPDYVEDGYVENGYQTRTGRVVFASGAGDVGYEPPVLDHGDDFVFPLTRGQVLIREETINSIDEQKAALGTVSFHQVPPYLSTYKEQIEQQIQNWIAMIERHKTVYELELRSVVGNADPQEYDVNLTRLSLPKQLDLSATGI